jgi:hypothetical protein
VGDARVRGGERRPVRAGLLRQHRATASFQERVWAAIERWQPVYILLPRTPHTLVRSPLVDLYFEQRLNELGQADYRLETLLLSGEEGGLRFAGTPAPGTAVLYELWRRH